MMNVKDESTLDEFVWTTRNLILEIAKGLVDQPDSVRVKAVPTESTVTLQLRVAAEDLGKVIGKDGRTARSIRTIVVAACLKAQRRVAVDIQSH